jgi:RHS repeat-associated protein
VYQSSAPSDPLGGLHLLGHRYYDPTLGRFLSRDPIGDGSNWYAYCANDPLGLADPGGLTALPVMAAVMAFENPPIRIRLVAALPGAHGYVFGHAWVDVVYWDGSAERFESLPFEGNKATCQPIAEDYFSAWTDVYVTERPIRRLKFRPDDG